MKRLMLILSAMAAGLSFSQGQLSTYTAAWKENAYITPPEETTVLATFAEGDQICYTENYECFSRVFDGNSAETVVGSNTGGTFSGIELPIDFKLDGVAMDYFLPMGCYYVALSSQQSVQVNPVYEDWDIENGAKLYLRVPTYFGPATVKAASNDSKIHYWTSGDDIFVVEYADMIVNNEDVSGAQVSFHMTWQIQFGQSDNSIVFALKEMTSDDVNAPADLYAWNNPISILFSAIAGNNDNQGVWSRTYGANYDVYGFVVSTALQEHYALNSFVNKYQGITINNDLLPTANLGISLTPPVIIEECVAPTGDLAFEVEEFSSLQATASTLSFPMVVSESSTMEADDYLFVLTKNEEGPTFVPTAGTVYEAGVQEESGDIVVDYTDQIAYLSINPYDLEPSTTYYLYVYPYNNVLCLNGPAYGSAYYVAENTTMAAPPVIDTLTYAEGQLTLKLDQSANGSNVLVLYTDVPFDWSGVFGEWGEYRPDGSNVSLTETSQAGDVYFSLDNESVYVGYYGEVSGDITIGNLTQNRVYTVIAYTMTGSKAEPVFSLATTQASAYVPATTVPVTFGPYPAVNRNVAGTGSHLISYNQQWPDAGWGNQPEGVDMSRYLSYFDMIFGSQTHYERFIQMSVPANGTVSFTTPAFTTSRGALTVSMELARAASSNAAEDFQSGDSFLLEYAQPETDAVDTVWNTVETLTSLASLAEGSIDGLYWWDVNIDGINPAKPVLLRVSATSGGDYSYYMLVRRVNVNERAACPLPIVRVVDVTDAQALATWTKTVDKADGTNSGYIFSYGPQGGAFSEPRLVSDTSFLMESLRASTTYTVNVRALCGEGDTSNVSERNFTTLRGLPYTMMAAQESNPISGSNVYASQNGVYDQSGYGWNVYPMYMENIGSVRALTIQAIPSDLTDSVLVALPEFYKESTGERQEFVTFKVGVGIYSSSNPMPSTMDSILAETSKLQVLLSTDGVFENADVIGEISGSELVYGSYVPFTFPIQTENEGLCRIGFAWMNTEADKTIQTDYTYILLDSVYVKSVVSPCDEISGPLSINQADTVTATTATIVLPESEALSYMFRYGVLDFSGNQQWDTVFTDSRVIELEGLAPATPYTSDVYQAIDLAGRYVCMDHVDYIDFTTLVSCYPVDTFALMTATRNSATFQVLDPATDSAAKVLRVFTEDASFDRAYAWPENTLYYTASGLTAGTDYMALVRVVCAEGDSSMWSADTVRFSTEAEPQPVCEVPTGLQAVPGVDNASLSWTAGEGNESFEVLYRETSASEFDTLDCAEASYNLTGLTAETSYSWTVIGVCGDLRSEAAEVASFTTASEPEPERCGVPTALASVPGIDTVALSWTAGENNVSFEVIYKEASAAQYDTVQSEEASCVVRGLTKKTAYVWSVRGICEEISSDFAEEAEFETLDETANENSLAAALRVLSQDDMIHILNPAKIRIDRVQVYTTTGARVADLTVRADNNVSIPVDGGRILLVNVFSGSENAIFKVYVR